MFALVVWAAVAQNEPWPNIGIHDGDNKIAWAADCCDGDTIVLDFRDEQADGNQGSGTLRLHNATDGTVVRGPSRSKALRVVHGAALP